MLKFFYCFVSLKIQKPWNVTVNGSWENQPVLCLEGALVIKKTGKSTKSKPHPRIISITLKVKLESKSAFAKMMLYTGGNGLRNTIAAFVIPSKKLSTPQEVSSRLKWNQRKNYYNH